MTLPKSRQDLLITKRHASFSPGYLEAVYPVLSPYTAPESHQSNGESHAQASSKSEAWDPKGLLRLSAADALDLVIATSGLFRDCVGRK